MNPHICEKEDQTLKTVLSGTVDTETVSHAQQCPACSDILLIAGFLQKDGTLTDRERNAVPDPGPIWQEARSRANQQAIRVALRPIRFMKIIACLAFACSPWFRPLLPLGRELSASCSRTLDSIVALLSRTSLSASAELAVLLGFSGTLILLGLSSWYMLRQE